ncbi:DUF3823 domain-containing protein [Adhaeribacter pallidiroseus]|uniref:DUF3823 domain-containing protein n=1 Tax=Adhaeribacter pallidiroseus TaxID=2072847 RepID=A0A369QC88_9BACT|nr:DUF3823 domain-containing protein [Adhaeribacter pallidiroseus]RDC61960.1 hypothetical protein AHMF7616_00550 [Adhaeribacter pallidiroseus]
MKSNFLIFITLAVITLVTGCQKDNYDPPSSTLSGRVVYEGQPIGVRSNGVQLELWQPGYNLFTKIPVYVAWDGTFSASLFDGDYKLVRLRGNGPWLDNADTINVQVKGSTVVDVPVTPHFIVKTSTFQKNGNAVTATINLQQINAGSKLERVNLYLGTTTIVDQNNNAGGAEVLGTAITDLSQPITLTVNAPANLVSKGYTYARIGVKTEGVAERLYSVPQQVSLK